MADSPRTLRLGRLEMQSISQGGSRVLKLVGELDLGAAPGVESELARVEASDAQRIVLDLSELVFVDSTGIALLVAALRRSEENSKRLRFVPSQSEDVERLLELCGLKGQLPLVEDRSA